jgi:hypothetical protein
MNKAFVKEPDSLGPEHCPRCGSVGTVVDEATLAARLGAEWRSKIGAPANFCPYPACEIVYFDQFERTVATDAIGQPVYPKDAAAPICACFGMTRMDVDDEIAAGSVQRIRELLAKAKSAEAHCKTAAWDGRSCVAEIQRYFMQRRGGG